MTTHHGRRKCPWNILSWNDVVYFLINFFGASILSLSMYKYVRVRVRVLPVARKTELIHIPMNK